MERGEPAEMDCEHVFLETAAVLMGWSLLCSFFDAEPAKSLSGHAAGDPREHRGFHWLQFASGLKAFEQT